MSRADVLVPSVECKACSALCRVTMSKVTSRPLKVMAGPTSTVSPPHCTLHNTLYTANCTTHRTPHCKPQCTLHTTQHCTPHCTLYTILHTLHHTALCILLIAHWTGNTEGSILCMVHYTLFIVHCTLQLIGTLLQTQYPQAPSSPPMDRHCTLHSRHWTLYTRHHPWLDSAQYTLQTTHGWTLHKNCQGFICMHNSYTFCHLI